MINGLLPWDSIPKGERQRPLPFSVNMDYAVVSPSLDVQIIPKDELLKDIMLKIPLRDQPS